MLRRSRKSPSLRHQLDELKKGVKVCGVNCDVAWNCTQHLTSYAQRAGPRFVQGDIEPGYRADPGLTQVWPRSGPRSDPGLNPGLTQGWTQACFTTLGRHTYHTPTCGHVEGKIAENSLEMCSQKFIILVRMLVSAVCPLRPNLSVLDHIAVLFLLVWFNVAYHLRKLPVEQARHHAFKTVGLIILSHDILLSCFIHYSRWMEHWELASMSQVAFVSSEQDVIRDASFACFAWKSCFIGRSHLS